MTETNLQQQIVSYLSSISRKYNFIFFSVPNEGLMTALKANKVPDKTCYKLVSHFKKMGMTSGVSDLVIMKDGKSYCMELKQKDTATKKYTQSKNQIIFEDKCHNTGVPYMVVRSFEQCRSVLFMWSVID